MILFKTLFFYLKFLAVVFFLMGATAMKQSQSQSVIIMAFALGITGILFFVLGSSLKTKEINKPM